MGRSVGKDYDTKVTCLEKGYKDWRLLAIQWDFSSGNSPHPLAFVAHVVTKSIGVEDVCIQLGANETGD